MGFKNFFFNLPQNLARIFSPKNLLWHLVAILLTAVLIFSGFDWKYFKYLHNTDIQRWIFTGVAIGGLVPLILPLALWAYGKAKGSMQTAHAAFALGQGAIAGYLVSIFYKALTGRAHPSLHAEAVLDITRDFRFGLLRGGVFWGWPSSHTAVAFGMAFAITALFPEKKFLKYAAVAYALFVGLSVSMSIHWFSDFVAGAILGGLAGYTVGNALKTGLNPAVQPAAKI